ncbi:beta-phosphoglucomutase [Thermosporothrix hazakensis]|jgi:beta-phosphoglucomutase|uniref:Beta-phosphoglucomutase n=2 Tax=Thermosporothrix TaxID=768650 RepID=A0A326UDG5_THEHA|nr:beta-phosphoglucomutase [Thermosporothrix hazakensis]PZW35985.1 beta-phosphoglucomutase [Thermosporothrix hazakensis]BBH88453.1 beta-phosphoglucomutase [Thermosporothrix sp. COM3]GCE46639.1 beta-phosphoglucomutase [Thermosporothrix hazakensis]
MERPKAIIFDLDGVLTDTSEYHFQAWKHLADDEGIPFTREENDAHLRGVGRRDSLMYLIRGRQYSEEQIQEMMERKNRYYNALIEKMTPDEIVPGGIDLLKEIRAAGIKTAIASASKNCRTVVERLQIAPYFDGIADGYSVVNGKPAPDLFVYAAGLLHTPTVACLGVEDAAAGIEAIKKAGMRAVAIGPEERFQGADKVLPTLDHKRLSDLLED